MREPTQVLIVAICALFLILPLAYFVKGNAINQPAQPQITGECPPDGCPIGEAPVGPTWEQASPKPNVPKPEEAVITPVPTPGIEIVPEEPKPPGEERRGIFGRRRQPAPQPSPNPGGRPGFRRPTPWGGSYGGCPGGCW